MFTKIKYFSFLHGTSALGEYIPLPNLSTSNIAYECNDKKICIFMELDDDPDHHQN